MRKKIETYIEICGSEKENSKRFEYKAYSGTNILLIYHSVWASRRKLYALKRRNLVAYWHTTKELSSSDWNEKHCCQC